MAVLYTAVYYTVGYGTVGYGTVQGYGQSLAVGPAPLPWPQLPRTVRDNLHFHLAGSQGQGRDVGQIPAPHPAPPS